MNTLAPVGRALQLTKAICEPRMATPNAPSASFSASVSYRSTEEDCENEEEPGLSQADLENTKDDRKHLVEARQTVFRLNADVKYLKELLQQTSETFKIQTQSLRAIQEELCRVNNVITRPINN